MIKISDRITYNDQSEKTTIVILPQDIGWKKAAMAAWFTAWMFIGTFSFVEIFRQTDSQLRLILIIFMIFWLYYAVKIGRGFFWLIWGKELIKIDELAVTVKNSIRGYGKAKVFYHENITKIKRALPKEGSMQTFYESSEWVIGSGRIELEYFGKTVAFARKIDEKEATQLFVVMEKRISQRIKALTKK